MLPLHCHRSICISVTTDVSRLRKYGFRIREGRLLYKIKDRWWLVIGPEPGDLEISEAARVARFRDEGDSPAPTPVSHGITASDHGAASQARSPTTPLTPVVVGFHSDSPAHDSILTPGPNDLDRDTDRSSSNSEGGRAAHDGRGRVRQLSPQGTPRTMSARIARRHLPPLPNASPQYPRNSRKGR